MTTTRRSLLKTSLGASAGAGLLGALPGLTAAAAPAGDYKALVAIFLRGGMDCHDTLLPTTPGGYQAYAEPRARLLEQYEGLGDDSRTRQALIGLDAGGAPSGVGLPKQLAPLAALYLAGHVAVAANVGPLAERTDRAAVLDRTARLPTRVGSHNDQIATWSTFAVEGAGRRGWGGGLVEARGEDSTFSNVTFHNEASFVAGRHRPAYRVGTGRVEAAPLGVPGARFGGRDLLGEHYAASAARLDNFLATDFQNAQRSALVASQALSEALGGVAAGDAVRKEGNDLSAQLATVAKMIAARETLGVTRQVFSVTLDGLDTHDHQARDLPGLQAMLADAMAAFYEETVRQGVAQDVLTFTVSEFGRTLTPNNDGTDHGWGGHHFLMGGGIRGGTIHGDLPEQGLGHDLDMDRGRLIPTTATQQYAGGIGRWFGVPDSDLAAIIPNLTRFGDPLAL